MTDLTKTRATDSPTAAGTDYLRKRRTGEGEGRRRLRNRAGECDATLDAENLRTWERVRGYCFRYVGADPTYKIPQRPSSGKARLASLARGASIVICNTEFDIPPARLAEIAGVGASAASDWARGRRRPVEVARVVRAWQCKAPRVPCEVELSEDAAAALAREARRLGLDPEVIASAAILAACSK